MKLNPDWSRGPHIRKGVSVRRAMLEHALALAPCAAAAYYYHGNPVLFLLFATVVAAVVTQQVLNLTILKKKTLPDGRATVTGLVLALMLPANTVWWAGAVAGALGFLAAGGLEHSRARLKVNPVVIGLIAAAGLGALLPNVLFAGAAAGVASVEAMPMALTVGGLFLVLRRHVSWRTPVVLLALAAAATFAMGLDPLEVINSGAWLMVAFFVAPDWRTCPMTRWGKVVSATAMALLAALLYEYLLFSGGFTVAVLVCNILTEPINRPTRQRPLGFLPQAIK